MVELITGATPGMARGARVIDHASDTERDSTSEASESLGAAYDQLAPPITRSSSRPAMVGKRGGAGFVMATASGLARSVPGESGWQSV